MAAAPRSKPRSSRATTNRERPNEDALFLAVRGYLPGILPDDAALDAVRAALGPAGLDDQRTGAVVERCWFFGVAKRQRKFHAVARTAARERDRKHKLDGVANESQHIAETIEGVLRSVGEEPLEYRAGAKAHDWAQEQDALWVWMRLVDGFFLIGTDRDGSDTSKRLKHIVGELKLLASAARRGVKRSNTEEPPKLALEDFPTQSESWLGLARRTLAEILALLTDNGGNVHRDAAVKLICMLHPELDPSVVRRELRSQKSAGL